MKELTLMKGNEALAEAAIRSGCDAYFGYPITPQSEVLEYLSLHAAKRTGMVVLQAESEVAAINMLYGAGGTGKKVMTSSSSPGISLMQEGISYIACAEIPCLIVNVVRGGPGLGTIQPSQGDYFQAVKGGGHGDYRLIVLAPSTVQEMVDFVPKAFDLAFRYRNPVMILADGALGQMMEKVELFEPIPRKTNIEPWATVGKPKTRQRNILTSLHIEPDKMEQINIHLQNKYKKIQQNEVQYESYKCDDAEIILTAYGLVARICKKTADMAREKGIKVGVFRPITLFPFPYNQIRELANKVKGILDVEMNAGQMIEDVKLAIEGKVPVEFHGRMGGVVPTPDEILLKIEEKFVGELV
ncbi:3-methyl-2-oxobutanoate dehydrogenase subunit VorB [Melioribacteraceae bacterium 4301-Me]|uniref:3-methyl-2-oxobutanoate dehydrogenase subunit VorB n=1 Tax=Pyranulibacter aquaticus TaxID=3163344 RepID=UPI003595080D